MVRLKSKINTSILFMTMALFIFGSCHKNRVYHEVHTFKDYKWFKTNPIIFETEITQEFVKKPLKIYLTIRHIQGFPYKFLHLNVLLTDPKGETKYQEISIPIISDELKYYGDGAGDYWDLEYVVDDELILEFEGKYKFEIKSAMDENPVNFLGEIGITIEKQEIKR